MVEEAERSTGGEDGRTPGLRHESYGRAQVSPTPKREGASCVVGEHEECSAAMRAGRKKGRTNVKDRVLGFALRAAGSAGIAFEDFARWLSPFGWSRRVLSPVPREMREETSRTGGSLVFYGRAGLRRRQRHGREFRLHVKGGVDPPPDMADKRDNEDSDLPIFELREPGRLRASYNGRSRRGVVIECPRTRPKSQERGRQCV